LVAAVLFFPVASGCGGSANSTGTEGDSHASSGVAADATVPDDADEAGGSTATAGDGTESAAIPGGSTESPCTGATCVQECQARCDKLSPCHVAWVDDDTCVCTPDDTMCDIGNTCTLGICTDSGCQLIVLEDDAPCTDAMGVCIDGECQVS
jgi:hypothetical protein